MKLLSFHTRSITKLHLHVTSDCQWWSVSLCDARRLLQVTAGAGAGWVGGQRRVAQAGWLLLAGPVLPDPGSLLRQFIRKIR